MTLTDHLTEVGTLILQARPAASGTYDVIVTHRRLRMRSPNYSNKPEPLVVRLTARDINKGPTQKIWDHIGLKLLEFQQKGLLP